MAGRGEGDLGTTLSTVATTTLPDATIINEQPEILISFIVAGAALFFAIVVLYSKRRLERATSLGTNFKKNEDIMLRKKTPIWLRNAIDEGVEKSLRTRRRIRGLPVDDIATMLRTPTTTPPPLATTTSSRYQNIGNDQGSRTRSSNLMANNMDNLGGTDREAEESAGPVGESAV